MSSPSAIVIGAGLGGIAAALRLRAKGYAVTIIDKQTQLGGRASVYLRNGYSFDAGPTVVTAHFLFDELFALFNKKREDYITFVPVYPWYRITFADGSRFDYGGTLEQTLAEIKRVAPGDEQGYLDLLKHTKRIFDVGFTQLGDVPFDSVLSMLKVAPAMISLGTWRTVWQMACKYIKSDKLRRVFSFQPLLVGGNPYNTTAIYSLIQYLEREWGVHFAMGGTAAIIAGLEKLMREEGIEIRLGEEVTGVSIGDKTMQDWIGPERPVPFGKSGVVDGVLLNNSEDLAAGLSADILVSNMDAPAFYKRYIHFLHRPSWSYTIASRIKGTLQGAVFDLFNRRRIIRPLQDSPKDFDRKLEVWRKSSQLKTGPDITDRKIDNLKYSMGLFVLYFGTTKQYPDVAHHTIILGEKYETLLHEMFDLKQLEPKDFSIYLHRPTATDPSMAPAGCDCFYALVPVPNLQANLDWKKIGDDYRNRVVQYLQRTTLPGLVECITEDFYVTPEHFRDNLNTMHGTGFSIQPTFTQSAYFRFHNRSEDIDGLYFVGAGTHPGAGMPGVLCSAKVLDRIVPSALDESTRQA